MTSLVFALLRLIDKLQLRAHDLLMACWRKGRVMQSTRGNK